VSTDRQLRRDAGRFSRIGARVLVGGLAMTALGVALLLIAGSGKGVVHGIGEMVTWLSIAPVLVGVVLLAIGGTAGWAGRRKPFA
jgi:hypothetical protein